MSDSPNTCSNCGVTAQLDATFCASCGTKFSTSAVVATSKNKKKPTALIVGIATAVLIVIVVSLSLGGSDNSQNQSNGNDSVPKVSMNDKCTIRVARWTDALSNQMMNGYGSASQDLYFTLGSQNSWTDWIIESAREYAGNSLRIGSSQAATIEVANIRQRCAQMGNPLLENPHGQ